MSQVSETFKTHHEGVLDALRAGASLEEAARTDGCWRRTLTRWLAHGRHDPDGPYGDFTQAVDSRHETEAEALGVP